LEQGSIVPGNGVLGLAAAYALGGIVNLIIIWVLLRVRVKTLHETTIILSLARLSVAALAMAGAVQISKGIIGEFVNMQTFIGVFAKLSATSILGLVIYAGFALLLRSPEMQDFLKGARKQWLHWTSVQEIEGQEHL